MYNERIRTKQKTMSVLEKIPELACPQCKGALQETDELHCSKCGVDYSLRDGIAHLVSDKTAVIAGEIAVQDKVAIEYERKRYQLPYARRYHDWWTDMMLSKVRTDGRILDNGCGIGLLFERLPKHQVVGMDLSIEMLRRASALSDQLVLGNSEEPPFKDNSFDVVF